MSYMACHLMESLKPRNTRVFEMRMRKQRQRCEGEGEGGAEADLREMGGGWLDVHWPER
jgi:hypothetical protein